ncbi:hypothetical protein NDN92_21975 [Burkholderia glumae]|nr:hypothetical protein [Burkholderia glumae]MCM2551624.1 hypothetical protein [Burkholderia glumae]
MGSRPLALGAWRLRVAAGPLAAGARRIPLGAGPLGRPRPELALGAGALGLSARSAGTPAASHLSLVPASCVVPSRAVRRAVTEQQRRAGSCHRLAWECLS